MSAAVRRSVLVAGFLAALAIRLAFLLSFPGDYDTDSYRIVAGILSQGGDPYRETERYNYSPVWGFVLLGADALARAARVRLVLVVGLLLLAADAATAVLLFRLSRRGGGTLSGASAALLFFANPISILISSYHCQFDGVSLLFLLFAVWLSQRRRNAAATAALSASVLVKHATWFHPLLFPRRPGWRGWVGLAVPYVLFFASFLPYMGSAERIGAQVFRHRGLTGYYGIEALLLLPGMPSWVPDALFVAAVLTAVFLLRGVELRRACLRLFLVILIFLPGFGGQYCVWPIALGALFPGPGFLLFTLVTSGFLFRIVLRLDRVVPLLPGWYAPWWAAIAWLLLDLRERGTKILAAAATGLRSEGKQG